MILPKKRDPRFITVRRGGTLQDADHCLLAAWAADRAQHVLHLFEEMQLNDERTRFALVHNIGPHTQGTSYLQS
jgi:hypothetical protein